MGDSEKGVEFAGFTIAIVAIIVLALVIQHAGQGAFVSLMGSIATVLTSLIVLSRVLAPSEGSEEGDSDQQQWSRQPLRAGIDSREPKSTDEYIELFERNPEYQEAGKKDYPNITVAICRRLKRGLGYLPIPEWVYRWSHRVEVPIAALAYLWAIIYVGQVSDMLLPIERYPEIRSLLYVIDPPTIINPITDMIIYMLPAVAVFLGIMWTRDARAKSTCGTCGEAYALTNDGCYYRQEGKRDREKTIDDKTYQWNEYEGSKVLRCTREDCGNREIRDADWDDKTLWQKYRGL